MIKVVHLWRRDHWSDHWTKSCKAVARKQSESGGEQIPVIQFFNCAPPLSYSTRLPQVHYRKVGAHGMMVSWSEAALLQYQKMMVQGMSELV